MTKLKKLLNSVKIIQTWQWLHEYCFKSLQARILILAALILILFSLAIAFILERAFIRAQEQLVISKLELQVYSLLGLAEQVSERQIWLPKQLPDPRWQQINSGLYGLIQDKNQNILWRSESLSNQKLLQPLTMKPGQTKFSYLQTNHDEKLFGYSFAVIWESKQGEDWPLYITVAETTEEFEQQVAVFKKTLYQWLCIIFLLLLVVQVVILKRGLFPLNLLALHILAVEQGKKAKLENEYLVELQPLVTNLNRFIVQEIEQRKYYQTRIADLAHSLKTPLTVLRNSTQGCIKHESLRDLVIEQTNCLEAAIQYHLKRPLLPSAGRAEKHGIQTTVWRLLSALSKVYLTKRIMITARIPATAFFRGSIDDCMELLGNVLDNAFKYCTQQVHISVAMDQAELILQIEDDGSGIPISKRKSILSRGVRLDCTIPGDGIGLALVTEICDTYDGELLIQDSNYLGGACIQVKIPNRK